MSEGAPVLTQDGTGIGGRGSIRASQYNVNVTGGNASVGNNSLMIVGTGTPSGPPQCKLSGESHYNVTVTGGNASVGDSSATIVGTGTPRTSSTTASRGTPV